MTTTALEELRTFPAFEFTRLTRCDGCGARAYTRFHDGKDSEWIFCRHHYNLHLPKFAEMGWFIDNQLYIFDAEVEAYNKKDIIT